MIGENIRQLRTDRGMSQEELALGLHVVRQTVSKWEQGLSVPDAEAVIKIADLLDVSVNELLGVQSGGTGDLTAELARVNALLAEKIRRERLMITAGKKRGLILLLSFAALIFSLLFKNPLLSLCLISICLIAATVILYRNLGLLTAVTTEKFECKPLKAASIFNIALILAAVLFIFFTQFGVIAVKISEKQEELFAMSLVLCLMFFTGIIGPKLPFNRHTGLRLPWTVADEDTWNVAHRVIGYISIPICLLYIAGALTIDNFEAVSLTAIFLWIGLPSLISLIFFFRKMHGKT